MPRRKLSFCAAIPGTLVFILVGPEQWEDLADRAMMGEYNSSSRRSHGGKAIIEYGRDAAPNLTLGLTCRAAGFTY